MNINLKQREQRMNFTSFIRLTRWALLTAGTLLGAQSAVNAAAVDSPAVRVHGEATSTGPTVRVQVFADITDAAIVSHSFRLFYPTSLAVESAVRNDSVWYFHDGSRVLPQTAPDTSRPGEVLLVGGRLDARSPRAGVTGNQVLLGTVEFRRTSSATPTFELSIGRAGQFASFVTTAGAVLEALPGVVNWQGVQADSDDQDLDGLNDGWEEKYFGTTKGVFYSDDSDRDGASNLGEQAMGSDPTDPRSLLRLEVVEGKETLVLEWPSVEGRRYTLEGAKQLNRFGTIQEGIASTPPRNTVELKRSELSDIMFFRVRVDPVIGRQ